ASSSHTRCWLRRQRKDWEWRPGTTMLLTMRVLVLGGTRFLSRETARQAVARGHEVVCAARGEGGEPPPGAQFVRIDRDDEHALSTPTVSSPWSVLSGHFDAVIDVGRLPSHIGRALRDLGERTTHWT